MRGDSGQENVAKTMLEMFILPAMRVAMHVSA